MRQYYTSEQKIFVPVTIVKAIFRIKEEMLLNPFQKFLIEAIASDCTVEQISKATLLTRNVIEKEINQMIAQNLLIRENEKTVLSKLSQKILMIEKCVRNLNQEEKQLYWNRVTGEIGSLENVIIKDRNGASLISVTPKFSARDIDGITANENFSEYMSSFEGMSEEDIKTVLSSVFVIFQSVFDKYMEKTVARIPCAIGGETVSAEEDESQSICAKCTLYKIEYSVHCKAVEDVEDVLKELQGVEMFDSSLLSEKGKEILRLRGECERYNAMHLTCFWDGVSGKYQFDFQKSDPEKKKWAFLTVRPIYTPDETYDARITEDLRAHFRIPSDFSLCRFSCEEEEYFCECNLNEMDEIKEI